MGEAKQKRIAVENAEPFGRVATRVLVNWGLLLTMPVWAGFAFWYVAFTDTNFKGWATGKEWLFK